MAGLSESALVGHGGITPLASCTQVPRDGIRAGSDQFRHAMVGADRVSLSRVALLLAVAGDQHVSAEACVIGALVSILRPA